MMRRCLSTAGFSLVLLLIIACGSILVHESGDVTITGFSLSEGCETVRFRVVIEQGKSRLETSIGVQGDTADLGRVGDFLRINLARELKITITVTEAFGDCDNFTVGDSWSYSGKLTKVSDKEYSVEFSQFTKQADSQVQSLQINI